MNKLVLKIRKMNKENSKLIEKTISSLDWDSICNAGKVFKFGIGEGVDAIPGLKKKSFSEDLTKNEYKSELKSLLKYVIENDLGEFIYGPWVIYWFNSEWELDLGFDFGYEEEDIEMDPQIGSSIEVIYSPQRISLVSIVGKSNYKLEESDFDKLENMLKKAIDSENYELASKIRDVIKIHSNESKDKKDI
jgi:hypothetical protein